MLYFDLPNFYYHTNISNYFFHLTQFEETKKFFKTPLVFSTTSGNFPYAYWKSGWNLNEGNGVLYNDIIQFENISSIPLRFNCGNSQLQKSDFHDALMNQILKINENGSNIIELNNVDLISYIKSKYPLYHFIYQVPSQMPIEEINKIIALDIFDLVTLPQNFDLTYCDQLVNPEKVELYINNVCSTKCPKYELCHAEMDIKIYNYCNDNHYMMCLNRRDYLDSYINITLEDINNKYRKLGFTHFKLAEISNSPADNLFLFLVDYFIKDEYKYQVIKEFKG